MKQPTKAELKNHIQDLEADLKEARLTIKEQRVSLVVYREEMIFLKSRSLWERIIDKQWTP